MPSKEEVKEIDYINIIQSVYKTEDKTQEK